MLMETTTSAMKATPPAFVASLVATGLHLETWVYVATFLYTVIQAAYTIWQWRQKIKETKDR